MCVVWFRGLPLVYMTTNDRSAEDLAQSKGEPRCFAAGAIMVAPWGYSASLFFDDATTVLLHGICSRGMGLLGLLHRLLQ